MKTNTFKKISCALFFIIFAFSILYSYQFVPYQGMTKKIITDHFIILFPKKYETQAQKTASYAEDIHKNLSEFMKWKPLQRTTIILTDHTDSPNGMAVTFIRNVIYLYITPLDLAKSLRNYEDPLYSLILHEYTHILHLDQIRGAAWFWRVLFGKLYCPASGSFMWYLEGVAVLSETLNASGGRLSSAYNEAIIKAAVREKKIPSYDKLVLPVVDWPHGETVYHYGARFVEYLYNQYGAEKFQEFYTDLSNDFWPFILQFVIKHKKIYGKSLNELWKEWIEYETNLLKDEQETEATARQLTKLEGGITSIARGNDYFLIASNSYKNDRYLYQLFDNGRLKKLRLDYIRDISITNDSNYILYTKADEFIGGFQYFDLYSLNLKTKMSEKLTDEMRISYISFAENNETGVLVGHDGDGSKLYKVKFIEGEIASFKVINLPEDIYFIDKPSISPDGSKAVFGARVIDGRFKLFILDTSSYELTEIPKGKNALGVRFVTEDTITFIVEKNKKNSLYKLDLKSGVISKIETSSLYISNGLIADDKVYYVDYTFNGEELFVDDLVYDESGEIADGLQTNDININKEESFFSFKEHRWKSTSYSGLRYIYPRVWGVLPYQLGSSAFFSVGNGSVSIPYIGPQLILYNVMPQGRFSYTVGVGLDYIKMYPDNFCSLNWKIPFVNISYSWRNWTGGTKYYFDDHFVEKSCNGTFPIIFTNSLTLDYSIPLTNSQSLFWMARAAQRFEQYNFILKKELNQIYFTVGVGYSFIKPRNKASRWDRGVSAVLYAVGYPPLLDNPFVTFAAVDIEGRVPFGSAFYFADIKGGFEFALQNVFRVDADIYRFSESITGSSSSSISNSINVIDTKAFPSALLITSFGSAFVNVDTGFDITIVKKSRYWHFATLGFKEFYIRPYIEFVYLYNRLNTNPLRGIMYDGVVELALDLFAAYGNITATVVLGGAVGHRWGDSLPAWSVFSYFKVGL